MQVDNIPLGKVFYNLSSSTFLILGESYSICSTTYLLSTHIERWLINTLLSSPILSWHVLYLNEYSTGYDTYVAMA